MKKINIQQVSVPDKLNKSHYIKENKFQIYLGNGVRKYFTNKKKIRAYLTTVNLFLNYRLHEVNSLFSECYSEYRKAWFYFTSEDPLVCKELTGLEVEIMNDLYSIDKTLKLLVERSHWINGNYFVFHYLNNISEYLVCIISNLQKVYHKRRNFIEIKRLELRKLYALRLGYSVMNYGKNEVKVPGFEYSELPENE